MDRNAKVAWRDDIVSKFDASSAVFLAQYSGLTVEDLTALRRELRVVNAEFHVVKNTIAKKAIEGRDEAVLAPSFKNQLGIIFAKGDVAAAAKIVTETAKKNDKLKVVSGYMEKSLIDVKGVQALASLPSREVLLAKIIGSLVAPHRGILGVMHGVPRALVSVINQIKEQKVEAESA
ncbi:MAG: 50S ribosomal protein L10 [Silvanigrellales bacterium]|nr:50S ribosomal protein L10 [Silvanigrellales bacterium]